MELQALAFSGELDGVWLFAERLLYVDWVDERALS